MSNEPHTGHGFGTMPVFLAGISTILGAVMFLRFGYAVGHVGLLGCLAIILLGHAVTIPTAMALAEIATNRKVEGGGEYFIISRSFGVTIGAVIGLSLYLSQAVSVSFYMIAFAEAFTPISHLFKQYLGFWDPRMVSVPGTMLLIMLMLSKGADLGVKALYGVVAILIASLVLFFAGSPVAGTAPLAMTKTVTDPNGFFLVFAIVFPAFTGMTAGVGLSGDLANPRKSIPAGTMAATVVGMVIYVAIVIKLALSAPLEMLATDQLVMSKIALWGPIIPIGLGAATLSSAIGSILVAPRTLQALGADHAIPVKVANGWLSKGVGSANEPRNATLITGGIALAIVALGNVDVVARLISMFFMVTYGALCAISFLEHFAAQPSYRPSFRSRWWLSLAGAVLCSLMMFQMDPLFAVLSIAVMAGLYVGVARARASETDDLAAMFQGVMTQLTRYMQIWLQRKRNDHAAEAWRPSVLMVSGRTFDRRAPLEFLRWICWRQGFGTYLHFVKGILNEASFDESQVLKERLIQLARLQQSTVYMDTIVSPSMISALAQSLQIPGVSGLNNNLILFEFSRHDTAEVIDELANSVLFTSSTKMAQMVLRHGDFHFGEKRSIHVWLSWNDRENANLMILMAYLLLGHPDWERAEISVNAALPAAEINTQRDAFQTLIAEGRIPISTKNIRFLPVDDKNAYRDVVSRHSTDADLVVLGFGMDNVKDRGAAYFQSHAGLKDVLFVHAPHRITIE